MKSENYRLKRAFEKSKKKKKKLEKRDELIVHIPCVALAV